ncbi:hypothetical protein DXG03_002782 [Asterophora parasitica]|uniref:Uncharacterized protein n=1 Tax=Asterophora parasitica TaxID=117018 RepID=A0A9P7KC23_9AGAR|nr:hypothetical protein DXG03_002782 [Asterophora parasitica]
MAVTELSACLTETGVIHTTRKILLALLHLSVAQYPVQLLFRLVNPLPVLAVDDKYEALSAGVVMPPKRANLVLASDVPHVEFHVLVGHGFHIEADLIQGMERDDTYEFPELVQQVGDQCSPVGMVVTDWFSFNL